MPLAGGSTFGGALVRQWLDFAQDLGVICAARIDIHAKSEDLTSATDLEAIDGHLRGVLPHAVPTPARGALPALLVTGGGDDDVGWYADWSETRGRGYGRLAFRGIGVAGTADALGGLIWRCELLPRTKVIRRRLLRAEDLPWRASGLGDWLRADVAYAGPETSLNNAVAAAIAGCRAVLRSPPGLEDSRGLWHRTTSQALELPEFPRKVSIRQLARSIVHARAVRNADDALTGRLLAELHRLVEDSGTPCRPIYHRGNSFYSRDGALQIGTWIEVSKPGRPVVVWIWFRNPARADRLAKKKLGELESWPAESPNSVYVAPRIAPDVLDGDTVDRLAAQMVPGLLG